MSADTKTKDYDAISLARGYPLGAVAGYLDAANKDKLHDFLEERHEERYFEPISCLVESSHTPADCSTMPIGLRNYGFAIMSLCCLLIETLQCYRYGTPTTSRTEWEKKDGAIQRINSSAPPEYKIQGIISGSKCFGDFFAEHQAFFPGLGGSIFYDNIRNGLLHQAQTKSNWKLVAYGLICDPAEQSLNRDKFAIAMREAFRAYLTSLKNSSWVDDIWKMARRKIWWLTELSK